MASPFDVSPKTIAQLNEWDLVRLANRLVWDEGRRLRLSPKDVRITLRINDKDKGIDAVTNTRGLESRHLGRGERIWQFKKSRPASEENLHKELRKKGVQEGFARGAGYTLVVGQDKPVNSQIDWQETLERLAREEGCRGTVQLMFGSYVAGWASSVPGAVLELQRELPGFQRVDRVLAEERHQVPFEADDPRRDAVHLVADMLLGPTATTTSVRIQGRAGVGKTRLGLECIRVNELDTVALYTDRPPDYEFFNWVAANEEIQVVLIVDECDDHETRRMVRSLA
jgi:hypothetical protein